MAPALTDFSQFLDFVVKKKLKRSEEREKAGEEEEWSRFRYHPYNDIDLLQREDFLCYNCFKLVSDTFEKCLLCNFGVFCSETCRDEGVFIQHRRSCLPACFNPICSRIGFKFFCCTEAVYCSSRCFHVDLQFDLSRHDCKPCPQFLVFHHNPSNMALLSREFFGVLERLALCKKGLFAKENVPTKDDCIATQLRVCAAYFPFGRSFKDSILGRLYEVKDLNYLLTAKACWEYVFPYLCKWFFDCIVKFACPQDMIALMAFEDFFHLITCKGATVLRIPDKQRSGFFRIHTDCLFNSIEGGYCTCPICKHVYHFDYLLWATLESSGYKGDPDYQTPPPIEGLLTFLWFYALHFNYVGVNDAHEIIHSFVQNRQKVIDSQTPKNLKKKNQKVKREIDMAFRSWWRD